MRRYEPVKVARQISSWNTLTEMVGQEETQSVGASTPNRRTDLAIQIRIQDIF